MPDPWAGNSTNPFAAAPTVNGVSSPARPHVGQGAAPQRLAQHSRSHSIDTSDLTVGRQWPGQNQPKKPTLAEMAGQQRSFQVNGGPWGAAPQNDPNKVDPFDVAWASKASEDRFGNQQKTFEVNL